ncbi:cas scaffolding protein family member 4 [Oryzias melastigma]|uniref:Cas scaffold protein family member 4 n=1 Tax=Oryzias melastigma TaxID=30732 RepID=A0A3B3CX89_ORYME|nr:cas scaffolding protein family member 4 [Oryzias melastigma]
MNKLAKALYDNTAECAEELAFRRGDILTVLDQNVSGTSEWWRCKLYGRHGLAPANRLELLPQAATTENTVNQEAERTIDSAQNIYQIPSVPRQVTSPVYEPMKAIYKVPSAPPSASKCSAFQHSPGESDADKPSFFSISSSPKGDVYDIPSQPRLACFFTESLVSRSPKHLVVSNSELDRKFGSPEKLRPNSPGDFEICAAPPPLAPDPNYDIPVPSSTELQHKVITGYSTLPNLRTPEWIYDVPAGLPQHSYNSLSSKTICSQPYNTNSLRFPLIKGDNPAASFYDIPKPSSLEVLSPPRLLQRVPSFEKPPTPQLNEEFVYDVPPRKEELIQGASDITCENQLPECWRNSSNTSELKRVRQQRMRNFMECMSFHGFSRSEEQEAPERERRRTLFQSSRDSQRISTASSSSTSSSTSSCDSLALSSSSPEPLPEVTLSPDEVCHKLSELQNSVVQAVPQLMVFVSSSWRYQEHLRKHLKEIKDATELISRSLICFLNFTLDIKGNARRLTDINLQTRLYKQLSIVEDSGVILQQTVRDLNSTGWPLDKLCQNPGQVQSPDQLDRFVMVARTVPDDVKRLVSIINANSKLLFRVPQKSAEPVSSPAPGEAKKCSDENKQEDSMEDSNDYVELEAKIEEKKPKEIKETEKVTPASQTTCPDEQHPSSDSGNGTEAHQASPMSEHCRLYFGALQKAIGGFVGSVRDGQPPEKFISQSKLVIMVGQRLVDTLCREAQREKPNQTLLCKSNHLCALLKQLAVATKKAALHFPDKQALCEAQEFAKELAQRAQHFRISLDI